MAKNNKTVLALTLLVIAGLFSIAAGLVWLGFQLSKSNSGTTTPPPVNPVNTPTNFTSIDRVPLNSTRNVDYSKLRDYLKQKDWRQADRETYERMLDAAGPKSQAKGFTPLDEMENLSCTDLKTIDNLWSTASKGQQGFTTQQDILRALGDYRKMYAQVGWEDEKGQKLMDWNYNAQIKRMEYKVGKEPNFKNPPPGHLPTAEREYNFDVSLNAALKRCSF
ncbi:GUN4 domain-containing protein [Argonema galeatum]|uniref:GUN4 domain-containing protein n=1 Tax=Argonema galeatum TaxID=2942762 RepID=UPI0020129E5A|nr:GUN4 domain-containing protein [Argonema galeatum]MCL1467988.1 GUN4 domain-containing protein [Argonema galeatum A003/A1]